MEVLIVLTSHSQLGNTGRKTGFWLEELAAPYSAAQTESTRRCKRDNPVLTRANTIQLSSITAGQSDAVFYPGGHGSLWDLANNKESVAMIENMLASDKPDALVCDAPGTLKKVKPLNGAPLVRGKHESGSSDTEVPAAQLTSVTCGSPASPVA